MQKAQIKKIAIQGFRGSFHEEAARKYFGADIDFFFCETFKELFSVMDRNAADYAVMAIENTVAGTILPNHAMLRQSRMKVIGEIYLPIQQNLLALKGQKIEDIKEVHSHPMAILQCDDFFEKHPHIRLVEAVDTALSAELIAKKQQQGMGAIASLTAAEIFDLQVLAPGIETNKRNFTRFLVLTSAASTAVDVNPNKASVCFYDLPFPFKEICVKHLGNPNVMLLNSKIL